MSDTFDHEADAWDSLLFHEDCADDDFRYARRGGGLYCRPHVPLYEYLGYKSQEEMLAARRKFAARRAVEEAIHDFEVLK